MMLHVDEIVRARVVRVEQYGVYLEYNLCQIVVFIPEISWQPIKDTRKIFSEGETVAVKIVEFIKEQNTYKGSIRQLTPLDNPYKHLENSKNVSFVGIVKGIYSDEATIVLSNNAWGHISLSEIPVPLKVGDKILVKIDFVDPENCKLRLKFADNFK